MGRVIPHAMPYNMYKEAVAPIKIVEITGAEHYFSSRYCKLIGYHKVSPSRPEEDIRYYAIVDTPHGEREIEVSRNEYIRLADNL